MENSHFQVHVVKSIQLIQFMSDWAKNQRIRQPNPSRSKSIYFSFCPWQNGFMVLWHVCSQNLHGMYNRPAGCCGCIVYKVFSICGGDSNNFGHEIYPTNVGRGGNNILDMILPSSPPSIGGVYFHAQNYCCHLRKYQIHDIQHTQYMPCKFQLHSCHNTINLFY